MTEWNKKLQRVDYTWEDVKKVRDWALAEEREKVAKASAEEKKNSVSVHWLMNTLAGMSFSTPGSAHEYFQKLLRDQGYEV